MPSCTNKRRAASFRANERGIALISVLWLIALLSVLALGLMALARSDRLNAHADVDEAAAEGWADAGVFLTLHKLCDIHLARDVPIDGQVTVRYIGGQRVDIATQDEFGKIDLNFAPKEILKGLLVSAGLSSDDSSQLADAIDDKRTSALRRVSDEREMDPSAPISGADLFPFHSIGELKSIPGITEDLFRRLRPALTVYSQQAAVQTATAPREVLLALPGMDPQKIAAVLSARESHPVTAGDIGLSEGMAQQGVLTGRPFSISSQARVRNSTFTRRAVILITGDAQQPYRILDWAIGTP